MVIVGKGGGKKETGGDMKTISDISPKAPFAKELSAKLTEDSLSFAPSISTQSSGRHTCSEHERSSCAVLMQVCA